MEVKRRSQAQFGPVWAAQNGRTMKHVLKTLQATLAKYSESPPGWSALRISSSHFSIGPLNGLLGTEERSAEKKKRTAWPPIIDKQSSDEELNSSE
ncbi:unnamed protein product [Calicophoron daubneyi]|uniref:Uncharacterized protein n=1 Tax=Calicophoron daubneyi TaxID=300641 RepID=A0AAV2SYK2_CALDB